jgi:sialic acid synthase SpsE
MQKACNRIWDRYKIKLGEFTVGHNCAPFIIAEAGINHNGDIKKAFKMIQLAKSVGVNAIKFQTFKADEFILDKNQKYSYTSQGKRITEPMLDLFKRCEFSENEWKKIKRKCDDEKILFLSTPQNETDLDLLLELKVPAIKVGSDDFTNIPLLKSYSTTKLPMIVSCGMSTMAEIFESLDTIGSLDGYPTILMFTTSQYPTPPKDVNILKLKTLANTFPMIPLGFSDHTQGTLASTLAIAFGACVFEKHFTLDHNLPGPDHWFSEDPQGLKLWVDSIRKAHIMLGDGILKPTISEKRMKKIARRSIVALQNIKQNELLTEKNLGLKRPGTGLPPSYIYQIYGHKAAKNIKKGTLINFGDFV